MSIRQSSSNSSDSQKLQELYDLFGQTRSPAQQVGGKMNRKEWRKYASSMKAQSILEISKEIKKEAKREKKRKRLIELREEQLERRKERLERLKAAFPDEPVSDLEQEVWEQDPSIVFDFSEDEEASPSKQCDQMAEGSDSGNTADKTTKHISRADKLLYRYVATNADPKTVEDIQIEGFVDLSDQEDSTKGFTYHDDNLGTFEYVGAKKTRQKNENKRKQKAQLKEVLARLRKENQLKALELEIEEAQRLAARHIRNDQIKPNLNALADESLQNLAEVDLKRRTFLDLWREQNVPPEKPSLDWISTRYDIFEQKEDFQSTFEFITKHAMYEPFILTDLSNFQYDRLPEFSELEQMVSPSPLGIFENTPENIVTLFGFIYEPIGFDIEKIESMTEGYGGEVINQYYQRPRTVTEYSTKAWQAQQEALRRIEEQQAMKKKREIEIFEAKRLRNKVPPRFMLPSAPELYKQLTRDYLYLPKRAIHFEEVAEIQESKNPRPTRACKEKQKEENRQSVIVKEEITFEQYHLDCIELFRNRQVTLQLPKCLQDDSYMKACLQYETAENTIVRMQRYWPVTIKETFGCLQRCAGILCRKSMINSMLRVLRRVLGTHITALFPQCYQTLSGLPVTIKLFDRIKVSFSLKLTDHYDKRRTLYVWDLSKVFYAIACFEERLKTFKILAERLPKSLKLDGEQKERLEQIQKKLQTTRGKKDFDMMLYRFRDLIEELTVTK